MNQALLESPQSVATTKAPTPAHVGSWSWTQEVLQDAYEMYGLRSERFATTLYWYIAYLFAHRTGKLHAVSVSDLKRFNALHVYKVLPEHLQDAASDLWLQLYTGEDARSGDGLKLWREGQRDRRRNQNVRTGMNAFRSNAQLLVDEQEEVEASKHKPSIHDWEDRGKSIAAWVVGQFKTFYLVLELEHKKQTATAIEHVDGFADVDDDEDYYVPNAVKIKHVLQSSGAVADLPWLKHLRQPLSWQAPDEPAALTPSRHPRLAAALERLKSDPMVATIAEAVSDTYRSGRTPNASAIARQINEQGDTLVSHDRVTRVIRRLRRELAAEYDVAKSQQPADTKEPEPTKAAKSAVISPSVPAFLRAEFARTGPLTDAEELVWGNLPVQRPRGLVINIVVAKLPDDTGPWYFDGASYERDEEPQSEHTEKAEQSEAAI